MLLHLMIDVCVNILNFFRIFDLQDFLRSRKSFKDSGLNYLFQNPHTRAQEAHTGVIANDKFYLLNQIMFSGQDPG